MSGKLIHKNTEFSEVLGIIRAGRAKAYKAVNVALIDTYWAVGEHLSRKVAEAGWGKGVVKELADWLLAQAPDLKGFSASNLWRMKQFYETYADSPKLAPLVRVLSWTHNLLILGQNKRPEEREFYLRLAVKARFCRTRNSHRRCELCPRTRPASSRTATCSISLTCRSGTARPISKPGFCAIYGSS